MNIGEMMRNYLLCLGLVLTTSLMGVGPEEPLPSERLSQEAVETVVAVLQLDSLYEGMPEMNATSSVVAVSGGIGGPILMMRASYRIQQRRLEGIVGGLLLGASIGSIIVNATLEGERQSRQRHILRSLPYRILVTRTSPQVASRIHYCFSRGDYLDTVLASAFEGRENEQRSVVQLYQFVRNELRPLFREDNRPLEDSRVLEVFAREYLLFAMMNDEIDYTDAEAFEEAIREFYGKHSDFYFRMIR